MRLDNDIFHLKLLCWTRVIDRAEADSNVQLKTIHRFVCNNPQIVFFPTIEAIFFWPILSSDVVHSRRFVSPPEKKLSSCQSSWNTNYLQQVGSDLKFLKVNIFVNPGCIFLRTSLYFRPNLE